MVCHERLTKKYPSLANIFFYSPQNLLFCLLIVHFIEQVYEDQICSNEQFSAVYMYYGVGIYSYCKIMLALFNVPRVYFS